MNASWIASYVFAIVLIACAVMVMFSLTCSMINRRAHQRANFQNEMRVMTAIVQEVDEEEHRFDVTACMRPAHCVSSVNPDGSVAVARELVVENKSAV